MRYLLFGFHARNPEMTYLWRITYSWIISMVVGKGKERLQVTGTFYECHCIWKNTREYLGLSSKTTDSHTLNKVFIWFIYKWLSPSDKPIQLYFIGSESMFQDYIQWTITSQPRHIRHRYLNVWQPMLPSIRASIKLSFERANEPLNWWNLDFTLRQILF